MTATDKDTRVMRALATRGITVSPWEARMLRRIERTLHRWAELECGDGNDYASWCIERDDDTGTPYMAVHPHDGSKSHRVRIADRERGALRRLAAFCARTGLHYYHQTDPRGCALYLSTAPLPDHNYTAGVAVVG